jgi:HAMP domain-containing protein
MKRANTEYSNVSRTFALLIDESRQSTDSAIGALRAEADGKLLRASGLVGAAILASVALSLILARVFSTPLLELARLTDRVRRAGDYPGRAAKRSNDEVGELTTRVRDTGIGIPSAVQARLFQAFSQADTSTTRRFGGAGLGLAISRRLVELMGGRIGVESQVGRGSTFWFTLPLARADAAPVATSRSMDALRGLRALVIDDNQTNRRILREQLQSWCMQVDEAESGPAGLAQLRAAALVSAPYRVVLLDLQMPDMSGLDVATSSGPMRAWGPRR